MTKIPSTENTEDFIYRFEIKKGERLHESEAPHSLVLEQYVGPSSVFHSMEITLLRDGQRADDVEFKSFEHLRQTNMTYIKINFYDGGHQVNEHDYMLTAIFRYFV